MLAAACPLPDRVAGVGHVFHRGEYWLLVYESCGHDQYFRRTADGLYDLADVEAEIRQRYATLRHLCLGADPCSVGELGVVAADDGDTVLVDFTGMSIRESPTHNRFVGENTFQTSSKNLHG